MSNPPPSDPDQQPELGGGQSQPSYQPPGGFPKPGPPPNRAPDPVAEPAPQPPQQAPGPARPTPRPAAGEEQVAHVPRVEMTGQGAAPSAGPDEPSTAKTSADPAQSRVKRPLITPPALQRHGPARIISLCNQKGGVGKTTSTINLGAALAEFGRRVLLVDFDPQGALSVGLGIQPHQLERTTYDLLMSRDVTIDDVLIKTGVPGMDLLHSNINLSAAEVQLVNEVAREQTLARALAPVADDYDFVLIDCQPSLGLLTVNALTASHGVIVPLECEYFSLRGVALLIDTIDKVRDRLNPRLRLEGILATMYDGRTTHGREVYSRVVEAFGDDVYDTVISRTVRFPETTVAGQPITTWAPSSSGAEAYRTLAMEVLAR
ncbi:MAG: ParA family protein [Jatrophihabitans sp.]